MGFWRTEHGIGGDSWADEMGRCMKVLSQIKCRTEDPLPNDEHEITMAEFADLVEFCSRGHIVTSMRHPKDADRPLSKLHDKSVKTYANYGQIRYSP